KLQVKRFKLWTLSHPPAKKEQIAFAKKIINDITEASRSFCGNLYFKIFKRLTQWDKNRLAFLQVFIKEIFMKLETLKECLDCENEASKNLDDFENIIQKLIVDISNIVANSLQDKWPDLIVE
ncbi:hypothetical protein Bhyg_05562, partial [Pseudolycoriella hygida]